MTPAAETDLYPPIKLYLEAQGYDVKAEIGPCDILAIREGEEPVAVEMKLTFSLALVMQGVARQELFDQVYLAAPPPGPRGAKRRRRDMMRLCRRLGLGLILVRFDAAGAHVEPHLDPGPFTPRRNARRRGLLLKEFAARAGDPNCGGAPGAGRITAYRQDALRLARHLAEQGPTKAAHAAAATGVPRAGAIFRSDHYRWFQRVERGVYALTPEGEAGLAAFPAPPAAAPLAGSAQA
ncbi:DUF2161 domain-containing phosphodiesterase [Pikeienuella sp. HZG-20]|uniref:DUF2161 domain-containing phosphodiesterase n=1 Tax=Paludibacillus litoralis TaxID=3133267 RepID=UPI0030ED08D6